MMTTEGSTATVVSAAHVVTPDEVLSPGWVQVEDDRITDVRGGLPPGGRQPAHPTSCLVPGFVDTHAHGGGGASFTSEDPAEALRAVRTHLNHGTTSMVASLVSAPVETLRRQVAMLGELVEQGDLEGVHLEGPWLSPDFKGAHDRASLAAPAPRELESFLDAVPDVIRMVTLAPELEHGLDATRLLVARGIVVAVGHTAADYERTTAAIRTGATVATHLFNAMPPVHHRDPGPVVALLEDPRVVVELVVDNHHLHPRIAAFAMAHAAGGYQLVSDAMAAAGAPDGRYDLGGLAVQVHDGVARLAGTDTLAGSTLTMSSAVRNAVRCGVSLPEATRAASTTPAKTHGLSDVGALVVGRRADLVLLDEDMAVQRVMRAGRWVPGAAT
jgi:N-acetylglucosamine-6-phosphate deacetylase